MVKAAATRIAEDTDKRARFVEEYLVDLNATQAATRAGYSPKSAHVTGSRLLSDAKVQAAISEARAKLREATGITRDAVLDELRKIGFSNLSDVADWGERDVAIGYDADGKRLAAGDLEEAAVIHHERAPYLTLRDRDELHADARAAVSEVALTKDGFKIKLHDKVAALDKLGRHLGLFKDEIQINGPVRFVIEGAPGQGGKE